MLKTGYFIEKSVKLPKLWGIEPPYPRWPPAAGALPQTPSCCFHILLQLRNLKAIVGGTKTYFAPRHKGTLPTSLVIRRR